MNFKSLLDKLMAKIGYAPIMKSPTIIISNHNIEKLNISRRIDPYHAFGKFNSSIEIVKDNMRIALIENADKHNLINWISIEHYNEIEIITELLIANPKK